MHVDIVYSQLGLHGSYVLAGIGKDGIIMAGDSRLVFFDPSEGNGAKNLAYYDSCVKIYQVGKFAIGFVGSAIVGNVFLGEMINIYKKNMPQDISTDFLIQNFINFFSQILPPSGQIQFAQNKIFSIGYKDKKPLICVAKNENGRWLINKQVGTAISSDTGSFVKLASDTMTCEQLSELAIFSINEYISNSKNSSVGGAVSVLKVSSEGTVEWIRNKPNSFGWPTTIDLLKDYFDKKIDINFFDLKDKSKMEQLWRKELLNYNIIR